METNPDKPLIDRQQAPPIKTRHLNQPTMRCNSLKTPVAFISHVKIWARHRSPFLLEIARIAKAIWRENSRP